MKNIEEKPESGPINNDISNSSHLTKIDSKIDIKAESNNNTKIQKLNLKSDNNVNNNNLIVDIGKNKKQKNVIILDTVHVIQVESWKKYNQEQSVEPNIGLLLGHTNEDEDKVESQNNTNNNKNNSNNKRYNNQDAKCTCLIF